METLKCLDLCCKAGGASVGIARLGIEVTGVDIKPQPHYPFKFIQADCLTVPLDGYDLYWASTPCQKWSTGNSLSKDRYTFPDLLTPMRKRLKATGKPYILENVTRAPLIDPVILCGTMFGLKVKRHRGFETFPKVQQPANLRCRCQGADGYTNSSRGYSSFEAGAKLICVAGHNFAVKDARVAMGIDWMTKEEIKEAVCPDIAEFITGLVLLKAGLMH